MTNRHSILRGERRSVLITRAIVLLCCCVLGVPGLWAADTLIDLTHRDSIRAHRPILIAHRGGVVTADAPECSLAAIRLAAKAGFTMVELDVRKSRDNVPVIFHDPTMEQACGVKGSIADFTVNELVQILYKGTDERIVTLENVLGVCRELRLGVMLDLKAGDDDRPFLDRIDQMIVDHGLGQATVSISNADQARESLRHVMFTPTREQMDVLRKNGPIDLKGTFWFGLPVRLPMEDIPRLQEHGALVFPAINTFRYPGEKHLELARQDIERLQEAGVDGFQIDSIYADFVKPPAR